MSLGSFTRSLLGQLERFTGTSIGFGATAPARRPGTGFPTIRRRAEFAMRTQSHFPGLKKNLCRLQNNADVAKDRGWTVRNLRPF
jgi:hypothetical protein